MTLDYASRTRPRRGALVIVAVSLLALAVAALLALAIQTRATRMADAREWTVSGPPCPSATAASLAAAGEAATQLTTYYGARFGRTHGAVRCREIGYDDGRSGEDFPVCEFDHPGGLEVTTSAGHWVFDLPPLRAATVQVRHGVAQCVVGSSVEID
jgi:hypothetical protein